MTPISLEKGISVYELSRFFECRPHSILSLLTSRFPFPVTTLSKPGNFWKVKGYAMLVRQVQEPIAKGQYQTSAFQSTDQIKSNQNFIYSWFSSSYNTNLYKLFTVDYSTILLICKYGTCNSFHPIVVFPF